MYLSHDFIAKKTALEFLVVFRQIQVRDQKVRGRCRLGWSAGLVRVRSMWERARLLKFMQDGAGLKFAGAGLERTKK